MARKTTGKGMGPRGKLGSKLSQKTRARFKTRVAQGLSGLTGGKKGDKSKGTTTIGNYREAQRKQVTDAARERNTKFKQTGVQTLGGKKTSFTKAEKAKIKAAGYTVDGYSKASARSDADVASFKKAAEAKAKAEAEAKAKAEAAKKAATQKSMFSSNRLLNKEGKQSGIFSRPDRAFGIDFSESWKQKKLVKVPAAEDGPVSGPTSSIRRGITNIGKFVLSPKTALLASNLRVGPLADGTLKGKPGFETEAGGLNVGKTPSETEGARNIRSLNQVTDIGTRDEATDARTNSLLTNAFNIGTKIPFVGPQLQNLKSDITPYTDRITVETPKNTKKVISEFVGNLDSMTDTTRRFVNEFATDNPNIPNKFGLETAADVVQTFNPMNKNYAPQLSTSWGKPLQAIANNFVSGGTKNIFQEAALNTGAEGTISPAEGLSIAKQINKNIQTPGTLGNFEATKLKNLADKYGGGTVKPTPGTIFKGLRGGSNTRNQTSRSDTGSRAMASAITTPEEFIIPEIPQQELPDLQNIQQQAYNQQMSTYGVPNYMAQFRPTQNVRPLRRRQYFNRDYFTQFA